MNRSVARPDLPRPRQPPGPRQAARAPEGQTGLALPPHADLAGSILCLVGLGVTAFFLQGNTPEDVARFGAWGVFLSLGISIAMDLRLGIRNLVRTDLMALLALYFLTLTEFLVQQAQYNAVASMESTRISVMSCIIAYAGMVVGRHLVPPTRRNPFQAILHQPVPSSVLFSLFWTCVLLGYLNMLIAVNFNVFAMVHYFMEIRFSQPWQRGTLGDWKAMLYETAMILYLIPPLGAILIARRHKHPKFKIFLVVLGVLFTFFYGFSSGTRNLFLTYLVTFLIAYCFAASRRQTKEIVILVVCSVLALIVSTKVMLDFRNIGLHDYVVKGYYKEISATQQGQTLAVDNNLYAITRMVEYFPKHHPFTNLEIPYLALIHPIPRVLWPGKPEGMSIRVEDILDASGWSVAVSVVGEEYIMHGYIAVFLMSVFFGACAAWWNLLASPKNSEFGILIYASGFYSAVITMRSMGWCSTALLPTLAGVVLGYIFLRRHRRLTSARAHEQARRQMSPALR